MFLPIGDSVVIKPSLQILEFQIDGTGASTESTESICSRA
jgi:hypothetical protein